MNSQLIPSPKIKFYSNESPNSADPENRAAFYNHRTHFMIFTVAGKPVFTRYGDESEIATLCASLAAIIPNLQEVHNAQQIGVRNNQLRYIKTDNMICVILAKNNLIYTVISKRERSYEILMKHLISLSIQVYLLFNYSSYR